jgi:hypothetical protein
MSNSAPAIDRLCKLPTKDQLRAAAFGFSARVPEWAVAERQACGRVTPPPKAATRHDDWVIAASQYEGWDLKRFQLLLARHSIESEIDRRARVLRVHRRALREACNLQRAYRSDVRSRPLKREAQTAIDWTFARIGGPPLTFLGLTLWLCLIMVWAPRLHYLTWAALFALICLTAFFTARALFAGLHSLRQKRLAADGVLPGRGHVGYPLVP